MPQVNLVGSRTQKVDALLLGISTSEHMLAHAFAWSKTMENI